jgi:hypothetical protein
MLGALPDANGPVWRSLLSFAGPGLKSIFDTSYESSCGADAGAAAAAAGGAADAGGGVDWGRSQPASNAAATASAPARRNGREDEVIRFFLLWTARLTRIKRRNPEPATVVTGQNHEPVG